LIQNQRDYFNENVKKWVRDIQPFEEELIKKSLHTLGIVDGDCVLDVGCGTGVLYGYLQDYRLGYYMGVDISDNMLEQFVKAYSDVYLKQLDFNSRLKEDLGTYDYVIIYNSIPHFDQLDLVFENAKRCLNKNGVFSIIHARSRQGLREHHKRIGYVPQGDSIPTDETLRLLCSTHDFEASFIEDDDFFYFSCKKVEHHE